jgi:hypothetical protein
MPDNTVAMITGCWYKAIMPSKEQDEQNQLLMLSMNVTRQHQARAAAAAVSAGASDPPPVPPERRPLAREGRPSAYLTEAQANPISNTNFGPILADPGTYLERYSKA